MTEYTIALIASFSYWGCYSFFRIRTLKREAAEPYSRGLTDGRRSAITKFCGKVER